MGIRSSAELEPPVAWSSTVGSVLCVARSGEGGVRAQDEAVRIAKDRGEPLVFLHVVGSSFLNKLAAPIVVDINYILGSLGRFLRYLRSNMPRQRVLKLDHSYGMVSYANCCQLWSPRSIPQRSSSDRRLVIEVV